jgi:hypothetical protein
MIVVVEQFIAMLRAEGVLEKVKLVWRDCRILLWLWI